MKIIFPVETFYPSQAGGAANSVYWLAKGLKKEEIDVTVVSTDKWLNVEIELNKWGENEAGRVIYVKTRFLHFPLIQMLIALKALRYSDVIHLSSIFFPTAFISAIAGRLLGKQIVWSPRGELDESALNHSKHRKRPILWLVVKLFSKYAVFHSTSNAESARIREVFGDAAATVQIPNYVELEPEEPRIAGQYLLYIGRFHPIKGIDNLIEAVSLSKVFLESEYELIIAGRGKPEVEKDLRRIVLESGLENKVRFAGHVVRDEKRSLLANAYFTIMPSFAENFGIVVLESLAQNTPVVAAKGTPWEVLECEKLGFWVENSPQKLAETIDRIMGLTAAEYEEYRYGGRSFVKREYAISQNIRKWTSFYEDLRKHN